MLLTIDIGNTNITLGAYDGDELKFISRLSTARDKTKDEYAVALQQVLALHGADKTDFHGSIISSVVPEVSGAVADAVKILLKEEPMRIAPGIKTGLNILIDNPAQLGADLLAGAVGAAALYPLPCLVVDLGTATKISVIDDKKAYRGCTIAPGVLISLQALSGNASQLPSIHFSRPAKAIGTNSIDSMQSGVVFGTAAMLDGLCHRIEKELGKEVKTIVATGGLSKDIVACCESDMIYNEDLVLYGLKVIFDKNAKK